MAKIRSIWPEMCESDDLSRVSASAERTFFRMLPHSDDEGRGKDVPKLLASKLYPMHDDMTTEAVHADLTELAAVGMILRYEVEGSRFYVIPAFSKYQRPKHKAASKLPSPDDGTVLGPDGDYLVSVRPDPEPPSTPDRDPVEPPSNPHRTPGDVNGNGVETDTGGGLPLTAENGTPLASRIADWLIKADHHPPESDQLVDHYRWAADALERQTEPGPRKLAARCTLAHEFVEQATGEDLQPSAAKQLNHLVRTTQHVSSVIRWLNEAVQRGAGLDPEHTSPRALVRYAVAVQRGERGAA